jgi:hypothetical protein
VAKLFYNTRIEAFAIKLTFGSAISRGLQEMTLILLDDHRTDAEIVKNGLNSAITDGHKEIVSHLLNDKRIEVADVKLAFLKACDYRT